jgi:hypothetical protein
MSSMHFAGNHGIGPVGRNICAGHDGYERTRLEYLNKFVLKCDLCKLLVDLWQHWASDGADEP